MKHLLFFLLSFVFSTVSVSAQDEGFYLNINKDTILAGNVLEISFIANNVSGQFEAPEMVGLNIVSGPNTSTSMSMVNGTVTQYSSYSYGIYAEEIGEVIIPPGFFVTSEGTFETEPTSIIVLPNPEGIIETPPSQSGFLQFSFPERQKLENKNDKRVDTKKKKRKLKKI